MPRVYSATAYSPKALALTNSLSIAGKRLVVVLQIEPQHVLGNFRGFHRLGDRERHPPKLVNLAGNDQSVCEFLRSIRSEFDSNVHVRRTLDELRIDHIGNTRLALAPKVFVEQSGQVISCDGLNPVMPMRRFNHVDLLHGGARPRFTRGWSMAPRERPRFCDRLPGPRTHPRC